MMADAALAAFGLLGDEKYLDIFRRAHGWFHGQNSLSQPLVDVHCGACYDGLQRSGVNLNQGAESTLAYLWRNCTILILASIPHAPREEIASRGA